MVNVTKCPGKWVKPAAQVVADPLQQKFFKIFHPMCASAQSICPQLAHNGAGDGIAILLGLLPSRKKLTIEVTQ